MADHDRVVARGKIKVDARRAIAKLRDHLLVDLHLYSTEIARVAVALGASRLDVVWDADDVILSFDGRPLPIDAISRARDHVLTPDSEVADGDALRVLGIGLSAALGIGPSFVDVYSADAERCARVRFEAKHLDEDASAASPEPISVARPSGMSGPGMRFHLRRRVSLEIFARAVRRDAPREIALLVNATRDAPLAVSVNGESIPQAPGAQVLVHVDLDVPEATRAVLEVLAPAGAGLPCTRFMELGVHLVESSSLGLSEANEGVLPLRVIVDARRLPTNASRSEVRADAELVTRVRARVPGALAAALAALEPLALGPPSAPRAAAAIVLGHSVTVTEAPRERFEDALGAIAAHVATTMRAGRRVPPDHERLMHLPLLLDATGDAMTLAALRGGTAEAPLLVYTGKQAAPRELAPWLAGIVWHRGRPAERALALLVQASANERVAQAREGHERRARALAHPVSRPALSSSSSYVLKQAFAVSAGPYAGLEGEVAVMRREGGYRRTSTARLFVDERPLETMQLPGVALPVDMALAWPDGIKARLAYDGVERSESVSRAVVYALRVAAIAVGERVGASDPELARLAILAFAGATHTLGDAASARAALAELSRQAVWPTTEGALVTLGAIEAYANRTGALCVAPASAGKSADGRPVVVIEHGKSLLALLPHGTALVDYTRVLARPKGAVEEAIAAHGAPCPLRVPVARKNVVGFVGIGPNRKRILHGGAVLRDEAHTYRNGPVLIVLEDRAAVPTPEHDRLLWSSPDLGLTHREEDALLELTVDACERGDLALDVVSDYLEAAQRKLAARAKLDGRRDEGQWAAALEPRLAALPARVERTRRELAKAALLARKRVPSGAPADAPSATVSSPSGMVTATLLRGSDRAPVNGPVLYDGHLVESRSLVAAPVHITVEVAQEGLLKDWATLSEHGLAWARQAALDAVLRLLADLARTDGFANDADALRLCEKLAESETAMVRGRIVPILRAARWPTVQGGMSTLGATGTLSYGTEAYSPYRTSKEASPYDAPALHLPDTPMGRLRRSALERTGFELADVTRPVARLQDLRARGACADTPAPRLPGTPAHPLLRLSLAKAGVTLAEGELELVEGPTSVVTRVDGRGALQPLSFALPVPAHVIFRCSGEVGPSVGAELTAATVHHLRELARKAVLDELPPFVRDRLRALVCAEVARAELTPADAALAVFMSKEGSFWSLAQLIELGTVRRTRDRALWAVPNPNAPIVVLSDEEAHLLASVLRTQDCTDELREAQRGHERRTAAPLAALSLSEHLRASCIYTFSLDEGGIRGEVGVLRPSHAGDRGISVHTTMRPVTTTDDGPSSWPTVATVDVEGLETTRGFDGLADRTATMRIQRTVRAAVAAHAVEILPAPPGALGVLRTPAPFMARNPDGRATDLPVPCMGVFWLSPEWPEAPTVHVEALDVVDPFRRPRIGKLDEAHHRVLPIAGRVWICAGEARLEAALELVFRFAHGRLGPQLAAASTALRSASPDELAAYVWDLRLLGARSDGDPVKELASDRPDPALMRVAARRAPHLVDAATGDAPAAPVILPSPLVAAMAAMRTPPATTPTPTTATTDAPLPEATFLHGLVRWVVELVTPAPEPESESPLTQSLEKALTAMKLTGEPVARVVESKRGRPVRYDAKKKLVVVNPSHPTAAALEAHPSCEVFLLAAAVSEINRELVSVTDAEEAAVLLDLLRDG